MKKVLIIMGGFFPGKNYGGPPVSVDNICSLLKPEYDFYIITKDHDLGSSERYDSISEGWNDRGNCKVLYLSDDEYNKQTFEKEIKQLSPDVIYLQGLFQKSILPSLQLGKKHGIKVVLAPRGEICKGALKLKKLKKLFYIYALRFFGLFKRVSFQSTSDEETDAICKYLGAKKENITFVSNIPSIPKREYVRSSKKKGTINAVFISRIHGKKNLGYALELLPSLKGKINFDIYGPIEDLQFWDHCKTIIAKMPSNVSVNYKGPFTHDEVHEKFSQHDCFLFPTLSENYGHVIAESLMVGTPVIISDTTPWTDINGTGAGFAISLEDRNKFINSLQYVVDLDENDYSSMSKKAYEYVVAKTHIDELKEKYCGMLG